MKATILISVLLSFSTTSFSQTSPWSTRVNLDITVSDSSPQKGLLTSCLNRELRKLGDVTSTDTKYNYEIDIIFLDTASQSSKSLGWAMSTVVKYYSRYDELMDYWLKPEFKELKSMFDPSYTVVEHYLWIGPNDNLENRCGALIATIDSEVFEPSRKSWQHLQEIINSSKK